MYKFSVYKLDYRLSSVSDVHPLLLSLKTSLLAWHVLSCRLAPLPPDIYLTVLRVPMIDTPASVIEPTRFRHSFHDEFRNTD